MNCSPNISFRFRRGTLLLAALLAGALSLTAQQSPEERYERAMELFNNAQMEDACELFQQIQKEHPGFRETQTYLNIACQEAKRIREMEKSLFDEAVEFFNQGKLEDAEVKFRQAKSIPLKNPRYRDQINDYLSRIAARQQEDQLFAEGVRLFNEGKDTEARSRFQQVVRGGGPRAGEARSYLQRIAERREESAFNEGVQLFQNGDYDGARRRLQEVVDLNGKRRADAERYLTQIEARQREQRAFSQAVQAFQAKRYRDARTRFQQVVAMNGVRKAESQNYLQRIENAMQEEAAFQDGVRKFNAKDYDGARAAFQRVVALAGPRTAEARTYLTRIQTRGQDPRGVARRLVNEAQAAMDQENYAAALEKLQTATTLDPRNSQARRLLRQAQQLALELPLRNGLRAYFGGRYEEAERYLSEYLENNGPKRSLALFFRGATRSARFYLSGSEDPRQKESALKESALEDFRSLQEISRSFQPPEKYVSPKILALYTEAAGPGP
ncbi:MAG: tetratricopeptide repeat protein [Candidatus Acidoferrales bacterium]